MKTRILTVLCLLFVVFYKQVTTQTCNPNYLVKCDYSYKSLCEQNGCCWDSQQEPQCFKQWTQAKGYSLESLVYTNYGYSGVLTLQNGTATYGTDITPLHFYLFETNDRVRFVITDPNNPRWEVPKFVVQDHDTKRRAASVNYKVSFQTYPFGVAITRKSNGEVLFDSRVQDDTPYNGLVYEDQYLELSTSLPTNSAIYGLGEHIRSLKLDYQTYTLWNQDTGTPSNINLYGSHPFYMDVRPSGNAHGVLMLSSNGMDVLYTQSQSNYPQDRLTYKINGGILDVYVFLGPTPEKVVQQYTELVGKPYFIPFWVLGFHQCRYGYHNITEVQTVVEKYRENNIPLDTIWTDIDYMDEYKDFTFDPERFPADKMKQWVEQLHANNQQYMLITDPGIHNVDNYPPFQIGTQLDVWIKNSTGQPLIADVWPGTTTFTDWFHPNAFSYWHQMLSTFHNLVPFDGLWIDMNEIVSFCDSQCPNGIPSEIPKKSSKENSLSFDPINPPYQIQNGGKKRNPLYHHALSPDALHYNNTLEYNAHNLHGYMESWATTEALESIRKERALVISRSTFVGSGHRGGHWTGDINSEWDVMYLTIPDILNFNMYGIPLVGADICGFGGNTTEELCARWIELGAFYPFSRDHNAINSVPQELYVWPTVAKIGREVLNIRYSLLGYYYTLFYEVHVGIQGTVTRPLFFEFVSDVNTLTIDKQFLVGSGLLVSPVLTEGATSVDSYFPAALWYDYYTFEALSTVTTGGRIITLDAPLDKVNVHIRGGTILPRQTPGYTSAETRKNPWNLVIAFDHEGIARGSLYLDDGKSLDSIEKREYTYISFTAALDTATAVGKFISQIEHNGYHEAPVVKQLSFLGVTKKPQQVLVDGQSVHFDYASNNVLTVQSMSIPLNRQWTVNWH